MGIIRSLYGAVALAHAGAAIAAIVVLLATDYFDGAVVVAGVSRNGTGRPDSSDAFDVAWVARAAWFVFIQSTISAVYHGFVATVAWHAFAKAELGRMDTPGYSSRVRCFSWPHHAVTRTVMVLCIFGLAGTRELSSLFFAGTILALTNFIWLNVEYGFLGLRKARGGVFDWRGGAIVHIASISTIVAILFQMSPYAWNIIQLITATGAANRSVLRWVLLIGTAGLELGLSAFTTIDIWQVNPFRDSTENDIFSITRLLLTYATEAFFVTIVFILSAH